MARLGGKGHIPFISWIPPSPLPGLKAAGRENIVNGGNDNLGRIQIHFLSNMAPICFKQNSIARIPVIEVLLFTLVSCYPKLSVHSISYKLSICVPLDSAF